MYLSVAQICRIYGWSKRYVYKKACKHGWHRIVVQGQVKYLREHVDDAYWASRGRTGQNQLIR